MTSEATRHDAKCLDRCGSNRWNLSSWGLLKGLDMNNSLVALNQPIWKILYSSNLENVPQKSGVKICELPLPHTVDKIGWNTCINTLHHFLRTLTFEAS